MRPFSLRMLLLFMVWGVLFSWAQAGADPQSQSFSSWIVRDGLATVNFTVLAREATRLRALDGRNLPLEALLREHLAETIEVAAEEQPCERIQPPQSMLAKPGYLRVEIRFACDPAAAKLKIEENAFFAVAGSHVHFARFRVGKARSFEHLFTSRTPTWQFSLAAPSSVSPAPQNLRETLLAYVILGFEHILQGGDHIAFLLTLLLLSRRVRDVLFIVTGFTLGHSVTLSLAVLGIASPKPMTIEAMIGYTIALVAAENIAVRSKSQRAVAIGAAAVCGLLLCTVALAHAAPPLLSLFGLGLFALCYLQLSDSEELANRFRPGVTLLFGLIHGFAFANVLMEVGLPTSRLLPALFGFNIGVELGQVAIVIVLFNLGLLLRKPFGFIQPRFATDLLSAALCALGLFWFVQRSFLGS